MVYSRSSDVHSGGASISCASHQIYVVWGWGTNIALPREYHGESDVPCCVTASMGIFGGEIEKYWRYRGAWVSEKLYRVREVFPITLILPRSKVLNGVLAGVLDIISAVIANVASGKRVKGAGKSVSLFPWLAGSQYFRDGKPLLPIELLGNVEFGNCGNLEEVGNWQGLVGHLGSYHCECIKWWCGHRRIGVGITATYHKIHNILPCSHQGLTY